MARIPNSRKYTDDVGHVRPAPAESEIGDALERSIAEPRVAEVPELITPRAARNNQYIESKPNRHTPSQPSSPFAPLIAFAAIVGTVILIAMLVTHKSEEGNNQLVPSRNSSLVSDFFTFTICNQNNRWAAAATTGRRDSNTETWLVEGWWRVPPGQCITTGSYAVGHFYAFGEELSNPQVRWTSSDRAFCIEYPGPFRRATTLPCASSQVRYFREFLVSGETLTWTLQ